MTLPHRVVLCADDYGLTAGVSRAIVELARQGRISATSVMANMGSWPAWAPDLDPVRDRIGVGLHLNLTTGAPLGPMPTVAPSGRLPKLEEVLHRAFRARLPADEVRGEIERQLDAFERFFGGPPSFVDGHQHVHVLPVVRQALLAVLSERGLAGRVWLRDPSDGIVPILRREVSANKALIVKALAIGFRRAARAAGFDTNEGFSGFSTLAPDLPAARMMERAFLDCGSRPVVMCHPGYADDALRGLDPAVESRPMEADYLASEAFSTLLRERRIELVTRPGG